MKIGLKHLVLTTALASILAPAAMAQSANNPFLRGRYVAVDQRHQDDFDPEPVHAGAFNITSSLGVTAEYNDNIFARNVKDDDTIIHVRPEIEARSNWSSHELNAGLSVNHNAYLSNDDETTTDYNAFVGGRIDVQRSFQIRARVDAQHITEARYEPGAAGTNPVEYDNLGASVGAAFTTDRLRLEGDVGTIDSNFDGAASFRDATENYVYGRASYAVSPDVAFFLQGRTADLDYDSSNRDGARSYIQVGTNFELQAPFRGEIAIGQVQDKKDDPTQPDTDGLSLSGSLQWFPTQLTTVSFRANRGVFDPGLASTSSATNTNFGVHIDHELRRNIILFGDASYAKYEFDGTVLTPTPRAFDREDKMTDFKVGAAYKLNKHMRVDATYSLHDQESDGVDRDLTRDDFDQNIISLSLRIFP